MARGNLGPKLTPARIPAPTGGINTMDPGTELPPRDCLYAFNLIASEQGLRSRSGWAEWCTGLTGTIVNEVRVVMPFQGSSVGAHRLFATTDRGIYDVTSTTTSPVLVLAFASSSTISGWGVAAAVVTTGGHFLVYADEVNGLHYYSETTGAWAAYTSGSGAGQISGVDPAAIVSVTVWKNRLWLTQRDTAKAWYLDVGAIFGTATAFNFGQRFAHGGYLVGLYNWSTDGGSGLDTALVAIGAGGDVAIYLGTDPSSASTFGLKGVWFVGAVPAGRTVATDLGGDLMILSTLGAVPLSKLIIGNPVIDRTQYATGKIDTLFAQLASNSLNTRGWAMHTHPTDNAFLLLIPTTMGESTTQLAMSLVTRGWSRYRDLPLLCAAVWQGELWFGTKDGRVCRNNGVLDERLLSDPSSGTGVQWSVLTPFRGDATQKQVQSVRPIILADEASPTYAATVRYNFDTTEPDEPTPSADSSPGSWDYGLVWGTINVDAPVSSTSLSVTLGSDNDFPADDASILLNPGKATGEQIVDYDSWDGSVFTFTSTPTSNDHLIGELVYLSSPPDDDAGTWDVAIWGDDAPLASHGFRGAVGMGRDFAIALRGTALTRTVLVGIDVLYTSGGFL
jgi:hypothetical protein